VPSIKRIGVLTGGGDAPGLNAVIRAVVKSAFNAGIEVVGLEDSFDGLLDPKRSRILTPKDVTGFCGSAAPSSGLPTTGNPFEYPVDTPEGKVDYSDRVVETFHNMGLQALVVIGGDGIAEHRAPVPSQRHSGRRRAEDHRQRHRRHDELFRLRHRGLVCGGRDRPAAYDAERTSASWSSR
jgi:6-phosphofructokinase